MNLIAGLVIPIGIPCKQAKPEMERHPVTAEIKKESVQYNLEIYKRFCASYLSIHLAQFCCTDLVCSSKLVHLDDKNWACLTYNLMQMLMSLVLISKSERKWPKYG